MDTTCGRNDGESCIFGGIIMTRMNEKEAFENGVRNWKELQKINALSRK